jgi:hypothetical protein
VLRPYNGIGICGVLASGFALTSRATGITANRNEKKRKEKKRKEKNRSSRQGRDAKNAKDRPLQKE